MPPDAVRVLDVGCVFGFGSAALARGVPGRWVAGIEPDREYARQARRSYAWLPVVQADGAGLPVRQGAAGAVVLLDVLEHVADPGAVLAEARRALRPGGRLVLSVPYRGPLAGLDSLNLYRALRHRWAGLPPLEPSEESGAGWHRHFGLPEIAALLGPDLPIERVRRTGLGLAEVLHLALLLLCRGLLRSEGVYRALRYAYFGAYLLEDLLPTGRAGYHLHVRARLAPRPHQGRADEAAHQVDSDLVCN
ncbi:MAG TPA: class I SAM-dependent methyltransferase [Chloroflexota bacterium]|nr:class I SAM-dependent methyltransferase [Chloroflexota bacterium]